MLDLSASRTPQERNAMRQALGMMAQHLSFGDRLVAMRAQQDGIGTTVAPVMAQMPTLQAGLVPDETDSSALRRSRGTAMAQAATLFTTVPINGTDLFAAIHDAAERAHQGQGRHNTLVLLSDMLQCTRDVCMEKRPVPDRNWVARQRASGLVPNLGPACIVIVGADASTQKGVEVRRFWKDYFQAAGAELRDEHYLHLALDPDAFRCS